MYFKVFGIAFLCLSLYKIFDIWLQHKKCSATTEGVMVAREERLERDAYRRMNKYYVPVYTFEVEGNQYRGTGMKFKNEANLLEIGSKCKVNYNPRNPEDCFFDGKTGKELFVIVFAVVAVIFLFL